MKFTVCFLKPKGPLHLGERENWREGSSVFIHSDTLFSAFCHSYLLLYGDEALSKLLSLFADNNPPFLFSSVFPCWRNTLYFPVPKNQLPRTKEVKNIQFIEKDGFELLLKGKSLEEIVTKVKCIPSNTKPYTPWFVDNVPRVSLNRRSNHPVEDGGFFHFGEVFYYDDASFFFLIKYIDPAYQQQINSALRLLADEGIGGDRSSGKGLFHTPTFQEIDIAVSPDNGVVSLSLYYPKEEELTNIHDSYYELIERKGYIYSPHCKSLRRKSLRMFIEGSVFPSQPPKCGKLVDVTPEIYKTHPVYRYGLIFPLPCKME